MGSPQLSVIIPVSRPNVFVQCIAAFEKQLGNYSFEVIGVGDVESISCSNQFLKLIPLSNPHPNARRNAGIQHADGSLIALMDDDAAPTPNWVAVAIETALNNKGKVITGPEIPPPGAAPFAVLTHRVLSSGTVELNQIHVNTYFAPVKWYEVPFCNCVFDKSLWQSVNGLNETIPWHMDDFHFFFQHRKQTEFINAPALLIQHNRYPETFSQLLAYKWKLRKETGEKLVMHPNIYFRILPVTIAFIAPAPALFMLVPGALYCPWVMVIAAAIYFAGAFIVAMKAVEKTTVYNMVASMAILTGIQIITILAMYTGFVTALFTKVTGSR